MANVNNLSIQGKQALQSAMAALSARLTETEGSEIIIKSIKGVKLSPEETMQTTGAQPSSRELKARFSPEESPDDFKKNHQFKLDTHLVM